MGSSFGILRTNTGLTTNLKIVVGSEYDLYMDSIESVPELASSSYKKVSFNKSNYFDEMIPFFYKNLPKDTAFSIKYDDDVDSLVSNYSQQYDDIYQMGARNILDNKNYKEEYEFFAPIYFRKGKFPKYFAIFRVDGPGLIDLNKDNFKTEIINKLKCIKIIDLTRNTPIGEWVEKNFINNNLFPDSPLEVDFRPDEFTKWNGIDFKSGGYTYKSMFLNDTLENENTIFDLEKFIFDGYAKGGVVFPNILNISFLFDDTPATKESLRKWSINRYFGFYLENIDLITTISPYIPTKLKSDVTIIDNILSSLSGYPFDDNKSDLDFSKKDYHVEYLGNFYKVEQYTEQLPTVIEKVQSKENKFLWVEEYSNPVAFRYKIISDLDLSGKESFLNKNICLFDSNNYIIRYSDYSYFDIPDFELADVWLIEIDGKYHNLKKEDGKIKLVTDYGFSFSIDKYTYYINSVDSKYTTTVSLVVDSNNSPKNFKIYRVNFSDIKDFDTSIVDTESSKFEYELTDDITQTDETKLYFPDLNSKSYPNDFDDYVYKGKVINIPTSSEYTSNLETFRIINGELSEIWRKNSVYCRWGFQNSISSNDYPYVLNNSNLFEDYNRTTNPFLPIPSRIERNLDFFYTINSSTYSYLHHSLHIEDHKEGGLDINFQFDIDRYLTYSSGDYFSYIFSKKSFFKKMEISKNTKKYSLFNTGNSDITNSTLFRGIKFSIFDIDNIKYDDGKISNINLKNTNRFDDYKFSILLSDNKKSLITTATYSPFLMVTSTTMSIFGLSSIRLGNSVSIISECGVFNGYVGTLMQDNTTSYLSIYDINDSPITFGPTCSGTASFIDISNSNEMRWDIIDEWDSRQRYELDAVVVYDDVFYKSNSIVGPVSQISDNILSPYSSSSWSPYHVEYSIIWSPNYVYSNNDVVYNNGEYYKYNDVGTVSFWNPYNTYLNGDMVIYKSEFWMSKTASNVKKPSTITKNREIDYLYWERISYSGLSKWNLINLWNKNVTYNVTPDVDFVVSDGVVFKSILQNINSPTTDISKWERVTSIEPDTNIVYDVENNPVILMNDKYYIIRSNDTNSTLENGINIYVDHRWKNILVNIAIDDNTIKNISNTNRDDLYGFSLYQLGKSYSNGLKSPVNSKLTAINIINSINDLSNKWGFTDNLNYFIIDQNGSVSNYNFNNLNGLPHMIKCELPDEFKVRVDSLKYESIDTPKNLIKSNRELKGGQIDNINQLNYYNGLIKSYSVSVSNEFRTSDNDPQRIVTKNVHGIKNIKDDVVYRYSGYYDPIFYEIDIFERPSLTSSIYGNYKFDTSLTNFGKMRQRVISKVNTNVKSPLKLKDRSDYKSIYPMLDEFGYTVVDYFIFKSTWDYKYHINCSDN